MTTKTQEEYLEEMAKELSKIPEDKAQDIIQKALIFMAGCMAVLPVEKRTA